MNILFTQYSFNSLYTACFFQNSVFSGTSLVHAPPLKQQPQYRVQSSGNAACVAYVVEYFC